MNFLQRIVAALQRFMYGRYGGMDQLNLFLMGFYVVLAIVEIFVNSALLSVLSFLVAVALVFRMLSKNIAARQKENQKFLEVTAPVQKQIHKYSRRIRDSKTHKYFSCPGCRRELRVPRGRGNIQITCPHCHKQFNAKS